jgi:hypothetical protein
MYHIRFETPIEGSSKLDALMKFRDWLTNTEDPFLPFVEIVEDGSLTGETVDMCDMQALHKLEGQFMSPQVELFSGEEGFDDITEPGYYARLSAPGYLDCTEWSGPYRTELEAALYLAEQYGE